MLMDMYEHRVTKDRSVFGEKSPEEIEVREYCVAKVQELREELRKGENHAR